MAQLGFQPRFPSFTSPVSSHLFPGLLQAFGIESARSRGTQEERSTYYFFQNSLLKYGCNNKSAIFYRKDPWLLGHCETADVY